MLSALEFIKRNKLFKSGEIIGVGCSGGSDSIALLHFLASNKENFDIDVVAIHVDHGIRENSNRDAEFVKEKAEEFGVRYYKFKIDAPKLAKEKGQSLETAAREGRYAVFAALEKKGVVDKIALAHHMSDQAETILMHIFRGAGTAGAKGMGAVSEGIYVRPLLETTKQEILDYLERNKFEYVDDETNIDTNYNRNFVRHVLMKEICSRWPGAEQAIVNFSQAIKEDDDYISSQINDEAIIIEEKMAKIPCSYFLYHNALISRMIFKAIKSIGVKQDIERKHIRLIKALALVGKNGNKVFLPFDLVAVREYDYITIYNRQKKEVSFEEKFKCGEVDVPNFGKIIVKRPRQFQLQDGVLAIDFKKLPKDAIWRFRKDGDVFTKFGGGSKKLKSYLIDKKIPARVRDNIPVLASGNEIYVIAGVEISDKVRIGDDAVIYTIEIKK